METAVRLVSFVVEMRPLCLAQILARIHEKVENGSYYEAQQMYKTIFHRFATRKLYEDSRRVLMVRTPGPRILA